MKSPLLILLASGVALLPLHAAAPSTQAVRFDVEGRFTVEIDVPEGAHHAVLEGFDSAAATGWRPLVGGALDGRAARVIFRLPAGYASRAVVRGRTGPEVTVPAVELPDPSLYTVLYVSAIEEQQKINLLSSAAAKMAEWAGLPRSQSQANLLAWARANPLVAAADLSQPADNVSIRFTDGDICVLLNKPRQAGDPAPAAALQPPATEPAPRAPRGPVGPKAATGRALPASNRAVTAFSLEATFPNSAPKIGDWLSTRGYSVQGFGSTTVDQVMSWATASNPLGVLFWHCHGCSYKKADGTDGIGLVTRQYASQALSKGVYAAMRQSGELGLAIADGESVPFYTINSSFIRNHLRFAENSLVVMDACFGATPELADAFLAAGAGSYASWDWLSGDDSGTACRQVFDRLLGMNDQQPVSTVKERSFSLPAVTHWMSDKGYDYDPSTKYPGQTRKNARLIWKHRADHPAHILRPSLMRILTEARSPGENFSKLLLEGDFGEDPGEGKRTIVWGGRNLPVLRWKEEEGIVIRIPDQPPLGNIQVIEHENYYSYSNEVPMSEWTVPFTWNLNDLGTLNRKVTLNVKFRADIHGERAAPEMPVVYLPKAFSNMADCTGTFSASGTYSPEAGTSYTWEGNAQLTSVDANGGGGGVLANVIYNGGVVYGNGPMFAFTLATGGSSYVEIYKWTDSEGGVHTERRDRVSSFNGAPFFLPSVSIDPVTSAFKGADRSTPYPDGSETLSWPTVKPAAAPDDDTVR